jgi:DNA-3-methyladenine glycosylase
MIDHGKADEMPALTREDFAHDADKVAQVLIGCYLFTTVDGERAGGMIIETEAYDQNDPFAHCHPGADVHSRNESQAMSFDAGNAYIYRSGQLHCLNFVCGRQAFGSAVLIRALLPTCNPNAMYVRRTAWYCRTGRPMPKCLGDKLKARNLCNGPAVLCEALEIGETYYQQSKEQLSLFGAPFEIRNAVEKPPLISGIRIGLDAQVKRWTKEHRDRVPAADINSAGERHLRWGAKDYLQYCRKTSFDQKWKRA